MIQNEEKAQKVCTALNQLQIAKDQGAETSYWAEHLTAVLVTEGIILQNAQAGFNNAVLQYANSP